MKQIPVPPTPAGTSLAGKTIIVTGGNAGLGFESARQFLVLGASRVILACRSLTKGREAVLALKADPSVAKSNPDALIEVFELDLDDYNSGLRFSEQVKREVKELDILLNNGGMVAMSYKQSPGGHEQIMQVNCYTHLLICLELFPLLRATAAIRGSPTRITFVGSGQHATKHTLEKSPIPSNQSILAHFDDPTTFHKLFRYADSKLLVNAYCRRLATIAPSEVVVNNACPGLVQTGLDKNLPCGFKTLMGLARKAMARTVEEGARLLVYASAVAGAETNGMFIQNNKAGRGAAFLDGPVGCAFVDKLWEETVEDVVAIDSGLALFAPRTVG